MNSKPFPRLGSLGLIAAVAAILTGCAPLSKATLLESRISGTPPIGTVRLPTTKTGVSFQGSGSLAVNMKTKVAVGIPDKQEESVLTGLNSIPSLDSSKIDGGILLTQNQVLASGEASVFLSRYFRLLFGFDQNASIWAGAGICVGDPWTFEVDLSGGSMESRRNELWVIESRDEETYQKTIKDTTVARRDTSGFWRFDMTFTNRKGGVVLGYQALNFPVTKAPNNTDEYDRKFHTVTVGYQTPQEWGTVGAYARGTWTGKTWSPAVQVQYTMNLGGD